MLLLLFLLCRFFARVRPDLIGRLFHMVHHSDRPMYSCICVCLCVRMSPHFLLSSDFGSTIYLAAFLCTVFSALLAMMRVCKTNANFVSLSLALSHVHSLTNCRCDSFGHVPSIFPAHLHISATQFNFFVFCSSVFILRVVCVPVSCNIQLIVCYRSSIAPANSLEIKCVERFFVCVFVVFVVLLFILFLRPLFKAYY